MISFRHKSTKWFLADNYLAQPVNARRLADALSINECEESIMRAANPYLFEYETVSYSSRLDHPDNAKV
jgi:hypothetical protein